MMVDAVNCLMNTRGCTDEIINRKWRALNPMSQLIWLHLSDIHFSPKLAWRDGHAHAALLAYLKQCFKEEPHLRPDLIFCTGDIAFGALPKAPLAIQYATAKKFFDELLMVCGKDGVALPKERLFVVPGNHDIDRGCIDKDAQAMLYQKTQNSAQHVETINKRFNDRQLEFQNNIKRLADYASSSKRICRISMIKMAAFATQLCWRWQAYQ